MIVTTPRPRNTSIRIGTHFGLSRTEWGIGGVYRDDMPTWVEVDVPVPEREAPLPPIGGAPALGSCPGLVPFGVTRPPVLRLGGATKKRV